MSVLSNQSEQEKHILTIGEELLDEKVVSVCRISAGANSQVYVIEDSRSKYILKIYFRHPADKRNRLENEFSAFKVLEKHGIATVPKSIVCSKEENCAIYEYIDGERISSKDLGSKDIDSLVGFLSELNDLAHKLDVQTFSLASEACFSPKDVIENIHVRLERFNISENNCAKLTEFLFDDFIPFFEELSTWMQEQCNNFHISFNQVLSQGERILSPSDFGFHNALRKKNGSIVFLDFEYFGWDDPAKMISDFLLHPAMELREELKQQFMTKVCHVFGQNKNWNRRVEILYPLFGLKWCLIFLNEFIPNDFERRRFAQSKVADMYHVQSKQLQKSKNLLNKIRHTYKSFPYATR